MMNNMPDSRGAQPEPGERLFTFGLRYEHSMEEIDIYANGRTMARARAIECAEADYNPGWTLVELEPGGSAGLVTFCSFPYDDGTATWSEPGRGTLNPD